MSIRAEMSPEEVIRAELSVLRAEHREKDAEISALHDDGVICSLTLGRLKKEKLALKDRISRLEDRLTPDIIA